MEDSRWVKFGGHDGKDREFDFAHIRVKTDVR